MPREVIGVLPEGFQFRTATRYGLSVSIETKKGAPEPWVFVPTVFDYARMEWNGNYGNWFTLGRLADRFSMRCYRSVEQHPGTTSTRDTRRRQSEAREPQCLASADAGGDGGRFRSGDLAVDGGSWRPSAARMPQSGECATGPSRVFARDAAVRAALGAAKWRLLWSVLSKTSCWSGMGGALGIVLYVGLKLFRTHSPIDLPRLAEVELNPVALLFCMAMTIAAGIVAGLLPGIRLRPPLRRDRCSRPAHEHSAAEKPSCPSLAYRSASVWVHGTAADYRTLSRSLLHLLQQDKGFETRDGDCGYGCCRSTSATRSRASG